MLDRSLNLRHMLAILHLAETGGFASAAARSAVTQSALSQAVAKLESRIGTSLFDRSTRSVAPSQAGTLLVARLRRAFAFLESGERAFAKRMGKPVVGLARATTMTQLRALIAVAASGGYSSAARDLGLAQPSVHRAARELETICGARLFWPSGRGVTPTPGARQLARSARMALTEIERGFDEVRELLGVIDGRLSLGCLPYARTRWAPVAVGRLLDRYPDARVQIKDGPYDELLRELRDGRLDIILGALRIPTPGPDIVQEILFEAPLAIVVRAGHPLLSKHRVRAQQLAALEWIAPREGTPARAQFVKFFKAEGIVPPRRIIECSSLITTRALLLQNDRAALLSAGQARYEVESGVLVELAYTIPGTERPFGLAMRADWRLTVMHAAFLELVRAAAKEEGDVGSVPDCGYPNAAPLL